MSPEKDTYSRAWGRAAGWGIICVAVLMYFYLQILTPLSRLHCNDFKHLYIGAKILRDRNSPYNAERMFYEAARYGLPSILPYVYMPFTGIVLSPLTLFPFNTAAHIWFWINQALLFSSLFLIVLAHEGRKEVRAGIWFLYIALFYPLTRNFTAGQLNVVLLFCYALVWYFHTKRWAPAVGVVAAFATLFKLSPGILFLYFLWKRQWKNLIWACIFSAIFLTISIAIVGIDVHKEFIPILSRMSYGHSTWERFGNDFYRDPFNQSFNSLFHHLFTPNPYTRPWAILPKRAADLLTTLVAISLLALVLFLTFPQKKPTDKEDAKISYALFILLSLFLPALCWDHYFVQALWAIVLLERILERRGSAVSVLIFAAALWALAIPYNFNNPHFRKGAGILLMSLKLWGALAIFVLFIILRIPKYRLSGKR